MVIQLVSSGFNSLVRIQCKYYHQNEQQQKQKQTIP